MLLCCRSDLLGTDEEERPRGLFGFYQLPAVISCCSHGQCPTLRLAVSALSCHDFCARMYWLYVCIFWMQSCKQIRTFHTHRLTIFLAPACLAHQPRHECCNVNAIQECLGVSFLVIMHVWVSHVWVLQYACQSWTPKNASILGSDDKIVTMHTCANQPVRWISYACMQTAAKFLDDFYYSNRHWSEVG